MVTKTNPMKRTLTIIFGSVLFFYGASQIPNAGFENWVNGNPVNWSTSNFTSPTVVQVNNAHTGSSAMKMQWQMNGMIGANVNCPAFDSSGITKFAYAGRPTAITGWYISSFGSGDLLKVTCFFFKNGNPIGFVSKDIYGSTANYTQFSLPITYSTSGNSDSATINMMLFYSGTQDYNSFVLVDDLAFSTSSTGTKELVADDRSSIRLLANPSSEYLRVEFEHAGGPVKLVVTDLTGKITKTLIEEERSAGKYRHEENVTGLAEGIYVVTMESAQGIESRKLCVMRN